jgi:hypothetical protein
MNCFELYANVLNLKEPEIVIKDFIADTTFCKNMNYKI